MNFKKDAEYRLRLAEGFLKEALQDISLERWRSCVDNAQLSVENSAKAIVSLFEPVEKTHRPEKQLERLLSEDRLDKAGSEILKEMIPIVSELGFEQHLMTDYGDEVSKKDPWELFKEEDAKKASEMAQKCFKGAEAIYKQYT